MGNSDRTHLRDSRPVTGCGEHGADIETRVCRPLSSGNKPRADGAGCGEGGEATRLYRSGELTALLEPNSKPIPSFFPRAMPGRGDGPIASGLPRTEIAAPGVNVQMQSLVSARLDRNPAVFRRGSFERRSIVLLVLGVATVSFLIWSFTGAQESIPQESTRTRSPLSPHAPESLERAQDVSPLARADWTDSVPGNSASATAARSGPNLDPDASGVGQDDKQQSVDEREAVDLLIEGRHAEALVLYERLVTENPKQPVYAALVDLLTRQIGERCAERPYSSDELCRVRQ